MRVFLLAAVLSVFWVPSCLADGGGGGGGHGGGDDGGDGESSEELCPPDTSTDPGKLSFLFISQS